MTTQKFDTNKIRVRFAPSPTGYLHIGGARTALFNQLFAKNQGGKYLLRIEDTDKKRSTQSAINAISEGLEWLGLTSDEDPVFQSQNATLHQEIAQQLVANGGAYYCYTSNEELQKLREESQKQGKNFRFQSPWREKQGNPSELNEKPKNPPVIRLKAPRSGEIIIDDLVQGEIKTDCAEIDDMILLRSDGSPTYMLSVVVDDHNMGITHIIRGNDHLTNSFKQKAIYDALGWKAPQFAHIPLIHGSDGAKMSKRHGATSVIDYKEMGYLPEAMRNYLLRLGFADGDKEIINDNEAINIFDLKKVGKSPSRFDFDKLNHLNKHYIKQKSDEELFATIEEFLSAKPSPQEKNRIIEALKFLKEKPNTLKEIAESTTPYFDNFDKRAEIPQEKQEILQKIKEILKNIENWNHETIKTQLMNFAKESNLKIKDFGPTLRLALTFSNSSAGGIFDIIATLGKDLTLTRL